MVDEGSDRSPGLLLDTNIVIAALKQEEAALARLEETAGSLFVSVITVGELRFGARKSGRVEENLQRIEDFAAESNILPGATARSRTGCAAKGVLSRITTSGSPPPRSSAASSS
jgi:tRNA(fMet)-specific endonuclease VapC